MGQARPLPFVSNQSRIKTYHLCHRKYGWYQLERLVSATGFSAPEIGIAVHKALAAYHAGKPPEEAAALAKTSLEERAGPQSAFEDKTVEESVAVAEHVLRGYIEHWTEKDEVWAPLNQEIEFLVQVQPGWWKKTFTADVSDEDSRRLEAEWLEKPSGIWLRGRADNLSVLHSSLWLVDYKTASKMDPRDMLKYDMDVQLSSYIYGLSKQLTEDTRAQALASEDEVLPPVRVEGAVIDLLVKTRIPQYAREKFTRSNAEMEEFEAETLELGREMRSRHIRVDAGEPWKSVFYKNTDSCFQYGRACVYRDICLSDTPIRRMIYNLRQDDYVDEAQRLLLAEQTTANQPEEEADASGQEAPEA